jgi:divalent metal cation (Fe/Co/Zn/Cd) transporter
MDTTLDRTVRTQIESITRGIAGVFAVDAIRAHRFGPYLVLNLTITVDGDLSVAEGDAIASRVEAELERQMSLIREVHVHFHPSGARSAHEGTAS